MADAIVPQSSMPPQRMHNFEAHPMYNPKAYQMPPPVDVAGQLFPPMFGGHGMPPPGFHMDMHPAVSRASDRLPEPTPAPAPAQQPPASAPPSTRTAAQARQRKVAQRRSAPAPKRKATQAAQVTDGEESTDDELDGAEGSDRHATGDFAEVPRMEIPLETSSAAEIAKGKYNDVKDEKERKRLKRLLRNRVSAQQARERKKAYLGDLEVKSKEIEDRNAELEQRVNTLERENFMLRQILKNTTTNKPAASSNK
eukprot:CAMPEP_0197848046 /NCGR_PEP_ID=MMETSP1438-20131217/7893_1 /TAXON_ID=1461541 /ORGANISM="Pterosperma sp., Strain CCMP1384" /LENGTH=253 /DNA_ID=CAMNT_0043460173 /DNA_START=267 /DNA_END=1028 /DNA_ORIENTATION=-